jgi:Holliday junction resolvase RusA-like endonuclease
VIAFVVEGIPAPQGSKSYIGKGRMIESSKKVAPWRAAVRAACLSAVGTSAPYDGPLLMAVDFYLPRPKSAPKRIQHPAKYPDLSKLIRSTEDAMTAKPVIRGSDILVGAYMDDAQIVKVVASKVFATEENQPGATIRIWPIEAEAPLMAIGAILANLSAVNA